MGGICWNHIAVTGDKRRGYLLDRGWYENFLLQLIMSPHDLAPIADAYSGSIITKNVCDK